jgi:hypothetical protein
MAFINNTAQGAKTIAATQTTDRQRNLTTPAGTTVSGRALNVRGSPQVTFWILQDAGAVAAQATIRFSINQEPSGGSSEPQFLTHTTIVTPLNVPQTVTLAIPANLVQVRISAPGANGTTHQIAIMASV